MLKRAELRTMIVAKLMNKTLAGARVYSALPFPTAQEDCPCVLVYTTQENSESRAKHTSMFETTLTISIEARVSDDYKVAEQRLDELCEQIEQTLLSDPDLLGAVEGIQSWNTQKAVEDGGEYSLSLAIINMTVSFKRVIAPYTDGYFETANIRVDALDPADPNIASPGPDGRIEGTATITINP